MIYKLSSINYYPYFCKTNGKYHKKKYSEHWIVARLHWGDIAHRLLFFCRKQCQHNVFIIAAACHYRHNSTYNYYQEGK